MTKVDDMQRQIADKLSLSTPASSTKPDVRDGITTNDPLVLAICAIAGHYSVSASAEAVVAGLPLVGGRLALEHVGLAAARGGLNGNLERGDARRLADWELPVVVVRDGDALVVWSITRDPAGNPLAFEASDATSVAERLSIPAKELGPDVTLLRLTPVAALTSLRDDGAHAAEMRRYDWLWSAFAGSRRIYGEAILATLAINVLALAFPLYTMNVYDRVLPNSAGETMWALSIGVVTATLFDFLIKMLRSSFVDTASRRADVLMANYVYSRVLGARLALRQASVGVRANTLRELDTIREFLNSATLTTFGDLPFAILFIAMIAYVGGAVALVMIAAIPILLGIGWITQRSMARLCERNTRQSAQRNAVAVETLTGLETIKAVGAEGWAAARWESAVADGIRTSTEMRHQSSSGLYLIYAAQTLTQVAMVAVGFYLVAAGSITSGALIASTMLAGRAVQPLSQLAMLLARLHQTRIAVRLLDELVHAPQERTRDAQLIAKPRLDGSIAFEKVGFTFDPQHRPVLRDVSFTIAPGERVAIVGSIGSGKSTTLRLMQALLPAGDGRVLVDGLPVEQLDPTLLRRRMRLALQDAELFHGTVRSNICLTDPRADDAALLRAAETAGALAWISRLPRGFDTEIRERGAGLSGGQRQSVALARALIGDPDIVLLDEPTSDMDPRTERLLVERLKAWLGRRTLVIVTHRPAMFDLVDRLIVLDDGRKLLDGPKASVIAALAEMEKRGQQPPAQRSMPARKTGA